MITLEYTTMRWRKRSCFLVLPNTSYYPENRVFSLLSYSTIFLKCVFIFERERQSTSRGRAETEGDTESEAGSGV